MTQVRPITQPLVLISQVQRSGGTLLARLLDGHPQLLAHPHEIQWGCPTKSDWPTDDLLPIDQTNFAHQIKQLMQPWLWIASVNGFYWKRDGNTEAGEVDLKFDLKQSLRLFQLMCARFEEIKTKKKKSKAIQFDSRRQVLSIYLASFFYCFYDEEIQSSFAHRRYVTGFIPGLLEKRESVTRFRADYPDGWLISVIRDPSSWLASAVPHFRDEPETVIHRWTASTSAAISQASGRTILIDYRSLVTDTETVMRQICTRIGIDWNPCLLEPTFLGAPQTPNSSFSVDRTGIVREAAARIGPALPKELQDKSEQLYSDVIKLVV